MPLRLKAPGVWLGGNSAMVSRNRAASAWIGTSTSVRRALASLGEAGTIRTGYRWLEIVDVEGLTRISNES